MKLSLTLITLTSLLGGAAAEVPAPTITLGVKGDTDTSGALDVGIQPRVQWESGPLDVKGLEVEGGFDTTIDPIKRTSPIKVWGQIGKTFGDLMRVSLRGGTKVQDSNIVDLDLNVDGILDCNFHLDGELDVPEETLYLSSIKCRRAGELMGGKFGVIPAYNFGTSDASIKVGYQKDKMAMLVDGENREITLGYGITEDDKLISMFGPNGWFSCKYTRTIGDGKLSALYERDDSVGLEWADASGTVATIKAPIDGTHKPTDGLKFSLRRDVGLPFP